MTSIRWLDVLAVPAAIATIPLVVMIANINADAQVKVDCTDEETKERVRALVLAGIDGALQGQTMKLFEVWMKDAHESPPKRALTGLDIAVNAYIRARANALKWSPPPCQ